MNYVANKHYNTTNEQLIRKAYIHFSDIRIVVICRQYLQRTTMYFERLIYALPIYHLYSSMNACSSMNNDDVFRKAYIRSSDISHEHKNQCARRDGLSA